MQSLELDTQTAELLVKERKENIKLLESLFNVDIHFRGNILFVEGESRDIKSVQKILQDFSQLVTQGHTPDKEMLRRAFREIAENSSLTLHDFFPHKHPIRAGNRKIFPKSRNQMIYLEEIRKNDLVFAIGPAGTGKTFLAVAMAVSMLTEKMISRIILTRPAVEAGEKLGFLPGDMMDKVNPYLRPLYDALYHMLDHEKVQKLIEREIIEIAPLAFMRGRTLNESFIILDEAQNTTPEQMKMFLTRIGLGSKVVVTGDITQIDLQQGRTSGLVQARDILKGINGISFCYFTGEDVVRHELVQMIIKAYSEWEEEQMGENGNNVLKNNDKNNRSNRNEKK